MGPGQQHYSTEREREREREREEGNSQHPPPLTAPPAVQPLPPLIRSHLKYQGLTPGMLLLPLGGSAIIHSGTLPQLELPAETSRTRCPVPNT
ncbi:Hypothetical predicted protein [Pelobates cultripes]|uniref:Uncharacterized protein n=1 Tax=Pelobates cultripes TaxID=61616 RepID=A0AAD1TI42_PELCU|nr:Hypothetical predicted protein [Pelobates cultripes]